MSEAQVETNPLAERAKAALVALVAAGFLVGAVILRATWWSSWSWLGVGLMTFSPMAAAVLAGRLIKSMTSRPAVRRYNCRLAIVMLAYLGFLAGAILLYDDGLARGPLAYLAAAVAAAPLLGILVLVQRFLTEETDEACREMFIDGVMWSGTLTLCEAAIWGLLETFGKAPHLAMWAVPVVFFMQIGVTGPLAARKSR